MANSNNDFFPSGGFSINQLSAKGNNKKLLVLFLVDATRSMEGQAIAQVNLAIQELISELRQFGSDNALDIKLGIMSFTNSTRWEMEAADINSCTNPPKITTRVGLTCYGVIYHELNKVLQKGVLIEQGGKKAPPVLVLLTDGAPRDEYQHDLEVLEKNVYFNSATRSAVIMGEAAGDPGAHSAVEQFVSNQNMILTTSNHTAIFSNIVLATMRTIRGENMGDDQATGGSSSPSPFSGQTDDPLPGPMGDPFSGSAGDSFPGLTDDPLPGPIDLPFPGPADSPPFFDSGSDSGKDSTDQTPPDLSFQFPAIDPADQPVSTDSDPGSLDLSSLDALL